MAVKKKAHRRAAPHKKRVDFDKLDEILQERAEEEISAWIELTSVRGEAARKAYDAQDKETQAVLDVIQERLLLGANGYVRISPQGAKGESYAVQVSLEDLKKNALFVATEILKDFALFDFKVANYEFPEVFCAACGMTLPKRNAQRKAKTPLKKRRRR
jgi:hypothetical protein